MKTLVFDFDGTLADSFELVIEIAYELTGLPKQSDAEVARLRHLPLLKAAREMHIPLRMAPRLLVKGRQKMLERIHEVHPFPGIPEVLRELHDNGYHLLVISSNSEHNVRSFLRTNELEPYFDGVYGNASIFNKASSLKKVLKRNKLDAADCFYIGDEVRDVVAASKVGMEPVAVSWGYQAKQALEKYHPFAILDQPTDLLQIFPSDRV
jgi:HAD superfamily phosphatase (TIGR01681 family)